MDISDRKRRAKEALEEYNQTGQTMTVEEYLENELPTEVLDYFKEQNPPKAVIDFIVNTTNEMISEEARQAQFVSDVSHEIRTPLTAIRGTAETLLDGDVPEAMQQRFLNQIINECDRLTRLANDLLTLQRAEGKEMDLDRLDLRALVENCALLMGELLDERGITLEVCGEAPDVLGNADAINQILVNLIENASRYATTRVQVQLAVNGDMSVMAVGDDGAGFGDEDPAHLFDRFYRADQSRVRHKSSGNSGLGLAIVKALTTAMGGTVQAANLPTGGAVFMVAIPSIPVEDQE